MLDFKFIEQFIILELQEELIGQGHQATGNLVNSFEGRTMTLPNKIVIEILMDDYGTYVNEGRKAGGKKVPIDVLINWIEKRAIVNGDKEKKNLAFAIQQKIFKEGSPTQGSFKFSLNGRRKGFIDFVIENKLDEVFDAIRMEVFEGFEEQISDIIKGYNEINTK